MVYMAFRKRIVREDWKFPCRPKINDASGPWGRNTMSPVNGNEKILFGGFYGTHKT